MLHLNELSVQKQLERMIIKKIKKTKNKKKIEKIEKIESLRNKVQEIIKKKYYKT